MTVEQVVSAVAKRKQRLPYYTTARDYHRGRQELRFASADFDKKFADQLAGLRLNVCAPVVSAYTDKLEIQSWGDQDEAVEQGLSRLVGMVNREMVRCGDAYVLVWPNLQGQPTPRYMRADEIVPTVNPDDPAVLELAVRLWIDDDMYGRAMVIDHQGAERWRTATKLQTLMDDLPDQPSAWFPMDDDEGEWVSHDFGVVPVCWFRREADDTDSFGTSALDDVIPLQDAVNKALADLIVLSEGYSRPFWYLLNFRPTNTQNPAMAAQEWAQAVQALPTMGGQNSKFDPAKQKIFTHDGQGPFGQLDPADLSRLIAEIADLKLSVATVSGVPAFYFTQSSGDVPSGESLRVLASRLTSGVLALQRESGPVWRGVGELLGFEVNVKWADPMPEPEETRLANAVVKKDLGLPLVQIFTDLGYDNPEDLAAAALEEQAARTTAAARVFAEGNVLGV